MNKQNIIAAENMRGPHLKRLLVAAHLGNLVSQIKSQYGWRLQK